MGCGGFQGAASGGESEGFGVTSFPQHSLQKSSFLADKFKEGFSFGVLAAGPQRRFGWQAKDRRKSKKV